jgi:RimJ/RimL family protein N-acetyltransferase
VEECLKKAEEKDLNLLYDWRNESEVRKNSLNTDLINYNNHITWFNNKINSDNCDIYIYYVNNVPVGQVRLEYLFDTTIINYSIDINYRGKGYGNKIIILAESIIINQTANIKYIEATIKKNNIPSIAIFDKLGYTLINTDEDCNYYRKELVLNTDVY